MTLWRAISRTGLFAAVLLGTSTTASTETLRVGGTGTAMAMLPVLFSAFDRSEEVKLEVIPSLGSSGALLAVAEGVLDIAVSGRCAQTGRTCAGVNSGCGDPDAVCPRYLAAAPERLQEL